MQMHVQARSINGIDILPLTVLHGLSITDNSYVHLFLVLGTFIVGCLLMLFIDPL